MSETKVSRKAILPYIVKMNEPIKALNEVLNEMPDCGAKKDFSVTIAALNKKHEHFSSGSIVVQGEVLSEDEKTILENYRKQKALEQATENPLSSDVAVSDAAPEQEQESGEEPGKGKRRKQR